MTTVVEVFTGFSYPEDGGFTRIPNNWFDVCAEIKNLAELKVIIYVMRRTWGFQNYDEFTKITIEEFKHGRKKRNGQDIDKGTGLGHTAINDGINRAIQHGYLLAQQNIGEPGWPTYSYLLRMRDFE